MPIVIYLNLEMIIVIYTTKEITQQLSDKNLKTKKYLIKE